MKLLVVGVLLLLAHTGYSLEFEECSNRGEVLSVEINDCQKQPCPLVIGSNANVTVMFTTSVPVDKLVGNVVLVIGDVEQNADFRPDPCTAIDEPGCPLKTGDIRTYKGQVIITQDFPPVRAEMIWFLKSEKDIIACFAIRVNLVMDRALHRTIGHPRQRSFRDGKE